MPPLLFPDAYAYNMQSAIVFVLVNFMLLIWIGLVWMRRLRSKHAERVLAVLVFVVLAGMIVHAIVAPTFAR